MSLLGSDNAQLQVLLRNSVTQNHLILRHPEVTRPGKKVAVSTISFLSA
jgi:hypothetical protein